MQCRTKEEMKRKKSKEIEIKVVKARKEEDRLRKMENLMKKEEKKENGRYKEDIQLWRKEGMKRKKRNKEEKEI